MPSTTDFTFDVFLSHNSTDKPIVRELAKCLREAGLRVWFDEWVIQPGDDIYLAIEHGLEASRSLVLCLSPAALGSDWVGLERSTVLFRDPTNKDRRFIPLLLADCNLPDTLQRYKYLDFRKGIFENINQLLSVFGLGVDVVIENNFISTKNIKLTPYNLPRIQAIYGRDSKINQIKHVLQSENLIVVIEGQAGIGKTVFAVVLANLMWKEGFFDQIIWISGKQENLTYSGFLDEIAVALEFPHVSSQPFSQKKQKLFGLLQSITCLLVIDNLETIASETKSNILDFTSSIPLSCKVIFTTRPMQKNEDLMRAHVFICSLGGLDIISSTELIKAKGSMFGLKGMTKDNTDELLNELCVVTNGNPLAIILSIGQLRQQGLSLERLLANLRSGNSDIFSEIFWASWDVLSNEAKKYFLATSFFVESFNYDALKACFDNDMGNFDSAFSELLACSLVESNMALYDAELRFKIHPLTKAFAELKLNQDLQIKQDIGTSLAKYYTRLVQKFEVKFWEGLEVYGPLESERLNILHVMDWCWGQSQFKQLTLLAKSVADFLIVRGHWQQCISYGEKAVIAAKELGDNSMKAWILVHMQGYIMANRGDYDSAIDVLNQAYQLNKQEGSSSNISETLRNLARVHRKKGNYRVAHEMYLESLQAAKNTGDGKLLALILNELGKLKRDNGNFEGALNLFHDAIKAVGTFDNSIYAGILTNLSGVEIDLNKLNKARQHAKESLKYFMGINNQEGIATASWRLAVIEARKGNISKSKRYSKEAYSIFYRLGMTEEYNRVRETTI